MSFFFKHKLLSLLIIIGAIYWFKNPADRFGFIYKGFVVYNRIPVINFDFYVSPSGNIFFEDDLNLPSSVQYWYDKHLLISPVGTKDVYLFVGTGFDSTIFTMNKELLPLLQSSRVFIRQAPTLEAVRLYNEAKANGITAAILIKNR